MIDPLDFEKRPLVALLHRKRRLAALSLFLENCGIALWRALSWTAFFFGLWLLQIPSILGTAGDIAAALLFFVGLFFFLYADSGSLRPPEKRETDRRLEQASALLHRPLETLEDRLANPRTEATRRLWKKSRNDALETIKKLRPPLPRPVLARKDPAALRILAALVLVTGLVAAGPRAQDRLLHGLFPLFSARQGGAAASPVTLWITPPEYTAMPQITLQGSGRRDEKLGIPAGSIVKIRVGGGFSTPTLTMGERKIKLQSLDDKSWGLETEIAQGERLTLKQWPLTRARIAYAYIADQPPIVTVNGAPEDLPKGEMKLPLKLQDDYGVTDLTLFMDLDPMVEDRPMGSPYQETRAVMSPPGTEVEIAPVYDLSWHPWAGLPVVITLEGMDHPGQKSAVPPLHMTLPERTFSHPVAQKLVEFRKRLIWTPDIAPPNVAYDLEKILETPDQFQNDVVVLLALRSAASRLNYNPGRESAARVAELLWDTAIRLEDGNMALAARSMRDAQRALENLLKNPDATDEEIAKAMQNLREAMAEYFQEMAREMQKRMAENGEQMQIPPEMFDQMIQPEDLAAFLDRLQSEALSGDRDAAREMLSQLQQFMDGFDPSMDTAMPPQMQFMMDGISALQELIEKQQALLDQTRQQTDKNPPEKEPQSYPEFMPFDAPNGAPDMGSMPPPPQPPAAQPQESAPSYDTQANKVEQDSLRYILGQLMLEADEQLGEIPEKMQKGEMAMRDSAKELGENRPDLSAPHQEEAIRQLQDSMQDMAQQLKQMMKNMTLMSLGGGKLDPLGRPMHEGDGPSPFSGSRVKIPDQAERKRVQDILKTLRQRSGEVDRPDYELDYFRRLMKQF